MAKYISHFLLISGLLLCSNCFAEHDLVSASPQELARGVGHFEKAHSLLIAAIREYDQGYKIVSTDKVLDSASWRGTILEKAKELEVVLAPKAREIKVGSRFNADPRLLKTK